MLDGIRDNARSWGVKIIFGIIIVVFIFWGVGNMGGGRDNALALVNGEAVTLADYQKVLEPAVSVELRNDPDFLSDSRAFGDYKRQMLDEMMYAMARKQEAERLGIVVTPNELKKRLYSIPYFQDDSGRFSEELYRMALNTLKITPDRYLTGLEDEIRDNKLMAYIGMSSGISEAEARAYHAFTTERRFAEYVLFSLEEYTSRVEVSAEETAAYYDENKESFRRPVRANLEYMLFTPETLAKGYPVTDEDAEAFYNENLELFRTPAMFRARLIAVSAPPEGSTEPGADARIAKAKVRADEALARLKAGGDFAELAKEYSDDQTSARLGGLLPWLEAGDTGHEALNEAIKTLEPGQVSNVLRSPLGFHLIKMEDKKPSAISPFVEVRERIKSDLAKRRADENFANVHKEAEDALYLGTPFAELGEKFKLELGKSGLLSEDELKKKLGLSKEYTDVLVNAIAEAVASGKASTIPVPLNIKDGIALVRILDAAPAMVPPLEEVQGEIRAALRKNKGAALAFAAAEKALPLFSGQDAPDGYRDKVVKSKGATRGSDSLEPLGVAPELVAQLFFSKGGWMPQVFSTDKGSVIAKLASVEKPTAEKWEQDKADGFISHYKQWQLNNIVQAYLRGLYARTRFEPAYEALDFIGQQR